MSNHHEAARDKDDYLRGNLFITRIFLPVWEERMWTGYLQISHSVFFVLWAKIMSVTKEKWNKNYVGKQLQFEDKTGNLFSWFEKAVKQFLGEKK